MDTRSRLDSITRRERGRLIASLVQRLGSQHLELAEDVAQDALLKALSLWPYQGLPDNPAAWLARVAHNKAIDRLRRENRERVYDHDRDGRAVSDDTVTVIDGVADPELRAIFLCSHNNLSGVDRLALTLRLVAGFTAREIGSLFLASEQAMAQRLSRSKRKLARENIDFDSLSLKHHISPRLDSVLKVIYLMFSLGYAPGTGDRLVRSDVALEALRLSGSLLELPAAATPTANALHALLCFQASRLQAREDGDGNPVLFRDQDHKLWNRGLITQGSLHLARAGVGDTVSRYHLEAAIAAIYATSPSWEAIDWHTITATYDHLQRLTDSPVVAINACVASAFAGTPEQALARLAELQQHEGLKTYAPYHLAHAEVLRLLGRNEEARQYYSTALGSQASAPVLRFLEQRLASAL